MTRNKFWKGSTCLCFFFIYLTLYCSNWHKKGDDWTSVGRFQTSNICIVCIEGDPQRIVNLKENRLEEDIAAVRSHAVIFSTKLRFTNPRKTSIATFSAKEVTQWSIGLVVLRHEEEVGTSWGGGAQVRVLNSTLCVSRVEHFRIWLDTLVANDQKHNICLNTGRGQNLRRSWEG